MNAIVSTIIARLREPSTWAGISMLAVAAGLPSDIVSVWAQALAAVFAALAVSLPEQPRQ